MFRHIADNPQQLWTLLMQVAVFGLIGAIWLAIVTIWYLKRSKRQQELAARLDVSHGAGKERILRLWRDGEAAETYVPGTPQVSVEERLEQMRIDAGWQMPMPRVLLMLAAMIIMVPVASFAVFKNPLPGIVTSVVIAIAFRTYLGACVSKRTQLYEKQLVDALDLGGRSLKAGHPLSGAFRLISEEIDAPIGNVFEEIVEQESLGMSVQDSLRQAADRSRSPDMRIFAAAVIIQLRSGGNLADMMERVAWVIRERSRLQRRARVLTAEAQMSKWVLIGMPAGVFMMISILNHKYMDPFFTDRRGQIMLVAAVLSMAVGGYVMGRMAKLRY